MKIFDVRTIIKTIIWRVLASLITIIVALIVTRKYSFAVGIGLFDIVLKLIIYYSYERVYNVINSNTKKR